MPNRRQHFARGAILAACFGSLLASAAHAAEIYKWVDKDGKTHYSSRKEDAAGAPATTIRPGAAPGADASVPPAAPASNEEIIRRPARTIDSPYAPPAPQQRPAVRDYRSEAPADKCQLARDILSGKARRGNGAPTTAGDREIAESDVRTFCGK